MTPATAEHQRWMAALASAGEAALGEAWAHLNPSPAYQLLRPIEIGMAMLRGRIGGSGAPFNLGEATMTRAAVALPTGERGFAYMLGRRPREAELAAAFHALLQRPEHRAAVEMLVVRPAEAARARREAAERAAAAATRVDFSALVRGDG